MPLLSITGLTHQFGGLEALSDINISLKRGEIAGLIGPNGAGKTTVFNLVSGFYVPTRGEIVFNGVRLNGKKPHEIAALKIGRTFQNIRLWSEMTVLDNIRISQHYQLGYNAADAFFNTKRFRKRESEIKRSAEELLEVFNLADLAMEYPKNLPYGIQRRVEIARALSLRPELLMLDEPAAGLSTADVAELISYVRWIHDTFKLTIWMIEHQMQVIMTLCENITVIDFGKEIARGNADQIQRNPDVIKAYLGDGEI
jgi:branched-chain amino acid transport system ATP-binding protein